MLLVGILAFVSTFELDDKSSTAVSYTHLAIEAAGGTVVKL